MSSTNIKLFELKEAAKWSSKMDERKSAIRELASQGPDAISILEEIRDVIVAADELRDLCIAAIENIRKKGAAQKQEQSCQNKSHHRRSKKHPKCKDRDKYAATGFQKVELPTKVNYLLQTQVASGEVAVMSNRI